LILIMLIGIFNIKRKAESGKRKAESGKPKAESEKQKAESRKQKRGCHAEF